MKTTLCLLLTAGALAFCAQAQDQDSGSAVKVTTRLMPDGSKVVMKTDVGARTMESTTLDAGDRVKQRIVYTLDEQDQPIYGTVYGPNGRPAYKCSYRHDGLGRVTEEADYTMNDQLIRRFVYEYGSNGKTSRIRCFDAQGNELTQANAGGDRPASGVRKDVKKSAPFRHN